MSASANATAAKLFARARSVGAEGHYEYAIDLFIDGLREEPANVEAHQSLREIAQRRKASGGKDLGTFDKMKLRKPAADALGDLLNTERLLAYDPDNLDWIAVAMKLAQKLSLTQVHQWLHTIYSTAMKH